MAAIPYEEKKDDLYADAHVAAPQIEYGAGEGDYESHDASQNTNGELKRQLKSRHIAMISVRDSACFHISQLRTCLPI
jgi:amino acid permease